VFQGDRDHIHHRLVDLGLTPRRAVITLYGVAVLFTALALAVAMGPRHVVWAAAVVMLLVVWAGVRALGYWEVTEFQKSFLSRMVAGLRASGDAALRGAEDDIARSGSLEADWRRLCEASWQLGISELHLSPMPAWQGDLPELHSVAPASTSPAPPQESGPLAAATWSIEVDWRGQVAAEVIARLPLVRVDFDPARFAAIVRGVVRRHLEGARSARLVRETRGVA
jgi:hypothetical protein